MNETRKEVTFKLECDLDNYEIVERSMEQNTLMQEIDVLENEKKILTGKIKPKQNRIDELVKIIIEQKEERDVECHYLYCWDEGYKLLFRDDTGEQISKTDITEYERQESLL
jgi:hypothetical protein